MDNDLTPALRGEDFDHQSTPLQHAKARIARPYR
jgi:hypothetical protein